MQRLSFDWQPSYEAALLEVDPKRVLELIEQARGAIKQRLTNTNADFTMKEQDAIHDALHNLDVLLRLSKDEAA
jgi:hypothetical protein